MYLWVNADDYGWTKSCSEAICSAFEHGWLTTTTACVNGSFFDEAVEKIRGTQFEKCVGIHFNLTEGKPLSSGIQQNPKFCRGGEFFLCPSRNHCLSQQDRQDVYQELTAQAERFKASGLVCHHVDSHHHIHNAFPIFPIFMQVLQDQDWHKVRLFRNTGKIALWKKTLKKAYNYFLTKRGYAYSAYFGSFRDYLSFDSTGHDSSIFEIMTHPDLDVQYSLGGVLVDRDEKASYDSPYGEPLELLLESAEQRNDSVVSL